MRTLNLGILAHVDAGKTSLTERLLHTPASSTSSAASTTATRRPTRWRWSGQRGITIKSAVVSFVVGDVTVNLIDTPGHPDFIAEVERVLGVLDGAVLVVSAVEGVQAQTRVLMRTLQRLAIPTLIFVNKIDRRCRATGSSRDRGGSRRSRRDGAAARARAASLPAVADPTTATAGRGAGRARRRVPRGVRRDDGELAAAGCARRWPRRPGGRCVHPVYFGSAITGAGVRRARWPGIPELLPAAEGDARRRSGTVFKIERGPAGEKIAYVRMFSGTCGRATAALARRERDRDRRVRGRRDRRREAVAAGQIGKLWGLGGVRIGDAIGEAPARTHALLAADARDRRRPGRAATAGALHVALDQLAEQDPLINLRQDDAAGDLGVAVRRGAEGGHPGRRWRPSSGSTSRSARRRRSASSAPTAPARRSS